MAFTSSRYINIYIDINRYMDVYNEWPNEKSKSYVKASSWYTSYFGKII